MRESVKADILRGLRGAEHVGLCSRKRAERLGTAAAVAGGAIYTQLPSDWLYDSFVTPLSYPCHGTIGGEPVADIVVDRADLLARIERA